MKRQMINLMIGVCVTLLFPAVTLAGPDQYIGDAAIYSGSSQYLRPNVLLVIDNSSATLNTASGASYDSGTQYPSKGYSSWDVYEADQQGDFTKLVISNTTKNLENITCANNIIVNTLLTAGTYAGSGTVEYPNLRVIKGVADCDTAPKGTTYALGNFLNYTNTPVPPVVLIGENNKEFVLIQSHVSTLSDKPDSGLNWSTYWKLNDTGEPATQAWQDGYTYALGTDSQQTIIYNAIKRVVSGARGSVNFGAMVYSQAGQKGGRVIYPVSDLSNPDNVAYNAFLSVLPGGNPGTNVLTSQTARPQAETLLDAGYYFKGLQLPVSGQSGLTSPILNSCDNNFIILVTNGLSNKDDDTALATIVGDYDGDKKEPGSYGTGGTHYLDDVAGYLHNTFDASSKFTGIQTISTHTILAFQPDDPLVAEAATDGGGEYRKAANANELEEQLTEVLNNIVLQADTSFVAPVVPVSPENRTYSGLRVYLGFFKPITQKPWLGNLKKYGVSSTNDIVDVNGTIAIYVDNNGDGVDDNTKVNLPDGASNGSFKDGSTSYWSVGADGGQVRAGGVGQVLLNMDIDPTGGNWSNDNFIASPAPNPRKIYTYMGTSASLTNSSNAFALTNGAITSGILGVATAADRDDLINFVHGLDVYDTDPKDLKTNVPRNWILGDILHSKPLVINYATYAFDSTNEKNCSLNKTMIFVGANDGMFHAFRDCDGSEAWAFIPPDLLPNLQYLSGTTHTYFVDSSPSVYIYDADKDGNIETTSNPPGPNDDRVILIFGERRGGGLDTGPTTGFYYALDISNPTSPQFIWGLSNTVSPSGTNTDYSELGETWSEPRIGKVKIGILEKVVFFIGAGYDNCNEDARFGATQTFTGSCVIPPTNDSGVNTSAGASSQTNPKGRGIYVVEIATLISGVPSFATSGWKVWGYTNATNPKMVFSIPSEVSALDTDFNGFVDTLYVGDNGGNVWKFAVGDTDPTKWTGRMIFSANPGSGGATDVGRKIFYPPSVTLEVGHAMLYFGTGDREHPLNRDVVDRLYAIKDKYTNTDLVLEDNIDTVHVLVDVTDNRLQESTDSNEINAILSDLNDKYGWYIKLNQNSGEKVLAPALAFKEVYYTTYAPNTTPPADPCEPGNLGTARVYVVSGKTGEAVFNFDTTNDTTVTTNTRAKNSSGDVLLRDDRVMTLGGGIPSGIVLVITSGGDILALVGCGGALCTPPPPGGGDTFPIYWRRTL